MKTIKLNIVLNNLKPGDTTIMEDRIAKHFIAKGWGVEVAEEVEPDITPVVEKPVKRNVVSRKIPKG
jgi:hypothetical protein